MSVVMHSDFTEVVDERKYRPSIEVFESNGFIALRQDNGYDHADVVELTEGQAYDMLIALSRMLDEPIRFS